MTRRAHLISVCSAIALILGSSERTEAAGFIHVPAGGNLQAAINAAVPGDVIRLAAGATFTGPFSLPVKSGATAATPVAIQTAPSGSCTPPPTGVRLTPAYPGFPASSCLAKIQSGTTAAALTTAPGAMFWTLRLLEFPANQRGYGEIISLGSGDRSVQTSLTQVPDHLVLDQVYVHGSPAFGQKRGIGLNSATTWITNSYISDCKALGFDAQAISGWNGPGPYVIDNNYLEASGENFMLGGADPGIVNLVPSNVTFTRNHLAKPVAWRDAILATPAGLTASSSNRSGSLAPGTYYYKVLAVGTAAQDITAYSLPSQEISVKVRGPVLDAGPLPDLLGGRGGTVTLRWNAVANATRYRVYRSTQSGTGSSYFETSEPSVVDAGITPTESGLPGASRWTVKNLLELKNAQDVTIAGNLLEYNWKDAQAGYAVLFTPRNQDGTAPWSVVQRVTFENNIVRHVPGGINILGRDYVHPSQLTNHITVRNNLFDDLTGSSWGSGARFMLLGDGGDSITVDHNTVFHTDASLVYFYGSSAFTSFRYTNNMGRHNSYGFMGDNHAPGNDTITAYIPGAAFERNIITGASASIYPPTNQTCSGSGATCFPSEATWQSQFVSFTGHNYRLQAGSPYRAAGTDGKDLGADIDAINGAYGSPIARLTPGPPLFQLTTALASALIVGAVRTRTSSKRSRRDTPRL